MDIHAAIWYDKERKNKQILWCPKESEKMEAVFNEK